MNQKDNSEKTMNEKTETIKYQHEVVVPNDGFPFKLFLFEGGNGKYVRERHWHRSIEIFTVSEGSLDFWLNEKPFHLEAGECILVNSNEVHSIHAPYPNKTIVLQIPLSQFSNYFIGEQFIWFSHSVEAHDKNVVQLVQQMFEENIYKKMGYDFFVQGLFCQLEYLLVTEYRKSEVKEEVRKSNKQLIRLGVITEYLKEHYTEEISLERLAGIFGYSPAYLSRMFQKYAKINYKDYLQSVRLEHAVIDLEETDYSIEEIALNHGFPSSKAFSGLYRKKYGILPNEFRKRKKQEKDKKVTLQSQ